MNEYDLLLHWLSARPRGQARLPVLTDACAALALRMRQDKSNIAQDIQKTHWRRLFLGTLHRLGHVEPVGRDTWAVISTTVLWITGQQREGEAHIYGARSRTLWDQLYQQFGDSLHAIPQDHGPELWKFTGTRAKAEKLAHALGSSLYDERGDALVASLPRLADAIRFFRTWYMPVAGDQWEFFRVHTYLHDRLPWQWEPVIINPNIPEGVYRKRSIPPMMWLYLSRTADDSGMQAYLLDERDMEQSLIARWLALALAGPICLIHDNVAKTLAVPHVGLPLPVLLDRALRLASGTSPQIDTIAGQRFFFYHKISRQRARQVGRVLDLRVENVHG